MRTADLPGRADKADSGAVIILREPRARVRSRRAVLASLLAFGMIAGVLVAGVGTEYAWSWILLGGVSLLVGRLAFIDDLCWRVREVQPYRSIRRHLVITPESVGFRDAHRPLTLQLDGQPVPLGAASRLDLTRSRGYYHVSLVLDHEVLVLESLGAYESAIARARELATVLGLTPPPAEQPADAPNVSEPGKTYLKLVTFFTMTSLVGVVYWLARKDFPDHVALPLALAAVIVSALFATGRQLCLRCLRARAAQHARAVHGRPSLEAVWTREEFRMIDEIRTFALGSLVVVALVAAWWLARTHLPTAVPQLWTPEAPHICSIDVNDDGVPEVIGRVGTGEQDPRWYVGFYSVDARSGKFTDLPEFSDLNLVSCEPPFLSTYPSRDGNPFKTGLSAYRTIFEKNTAIWRVDLRHTVDEVLRSKGCALLRAPPVDGSKDGWTSVSLATGDPCAAIPEPVSQAAIDEARREQQWRGPPGVRTAGDITYSLTGTARLTLSAWRGETLLWTTKLPARPIDELPLAVAGGTVVLAANDLRTGKHLRILGVDAATGEIRYVRRHPRDPKAHVNLAAAGSMVFIEAGRLAGLDAASGQIAWITKEE